MRSRPRLRGQITSTSWAASAADALVEQADQLVGVEGDLVGHPQLQQPVEHRPRVGGRAQREPGVGAGALAEAVVDVRRRSTAGRRRRPAAGPARRGPAGRPGPRPRPAPPRRPRSAARSAPAGPGSRVVRVAARAGRRRPPRRTGRRPGSLGRQWPSAGSNRPPATSRSPSRAAAASAVDASGRRSSPARSSTGSASRIGSTSTVRRPSAKLTGPRAGGRRPRTGPARTTRTTSPRR